MAVPGLHVDGHDFVEAAAGAGAAAVLVERPVPDVPVAQLVVGDVRSALASAAAWWYEDPSDALAVVGITGTDGKTTTSFLAVAALEAAGIATGMTGTAATRIGGVQTANEAHATTPEAPDLQRAMKAMRVAGDAAAVIETTSHGLALGRVGCDRLRHRDPDQPDPRAPRAPRHVGGLPRRQAAAVREAPSGRGRRPAGRQAAGLARDRHRQRRRSVGRRLRRRRPGGRRAGPHVRHRSRPRTSGRRASRRTSDGCGSPTTPRPARPSRSSSWSGRFNAHNALAVVALGEAIGLDPAAVREGLASVPLVPGRMERIDAGQPFGVIVDFAHSPASLQTVLDLLAPLAAARGGGLIAVFGSAGERDTAKRPVMGRIAGERGRLVVVTDEDPRGEDRDAILDEIARGAEAAGRRRDHDLLVIADRRAAIDAAVERARPGDIVLLAGKGHEQAIIGPDGPVPWDERDEALAALHRAGYG